MSLAGTRAFVAAVGLVCLVVAGLSLLRIGGPEASRQMRRDEIRLDHIREIARALRCHAATGAPPAATMDAVAASCLAAARAADLADPLSGGGYRIARAGPQAARVCATFEAAARLRAFERSDTPFDRESGCVTTSLAP